MSDHTLAGREHGAPLGDELDRVLEIPVEIRVELGRRRMRIQDVLELQVGGVLELEQAAGSLLSIFANQTLVAQGEAVMVGERYGVRITEIVAPNERLQRLGKRRQG